VENKTETQKVIILFIFCQKKC